MILYNLILFKFTLNARFYTMGIWRYNSNNTNVLKLYTSLCTSYNSNYDTYDTNS